MKFRFDEKDRMKVNNMGFKHYQDHFGKKKKRRCMHDDCNKDAIRSHAISKNANLKLISDNNEVMTIKSQRNGMEWEMMFIPESINEASTFGGFCNDHDRYFERLDKGLMETQFDMLSQCYRSMAHTLYNYEYLPKMRKNDMKNIDTIIEFSKSEYQKLGITREQFKSEYIKYNNILWNKRLDEYRRIEEFKNELFDLLEMNQSLKETALEEEISIEYRFINSIISYKRIPYLIPLALVNKASVAIEGNESDLFYTIVPSHNCTHLIQFNYNNTSRFTKDFRMNTKDNISMLNYVERIMMYSENNWYVNPNIINNLTRERRIIIENDMYFMNERKFSNYNDISIFDDLRKKIAVELNENERDKELRKITKLPFRKEFEERKKESSIKLEDVWLCK